MKRSLFFIALIFVFCRMSCGCGDESPTYYNVENTLDTDIEIIISGYRDSGDHGKSESKTFTAKPGESITIHITFPSSEDDHISQERMLFFDSISINAGDLTTSKDFRALLEWDNPDNDYSLIISEEDF